MQCRHTVADWHRYVDPGGVTAPIFAACRLLIKEGEQPRDPQGIACAYWGRQGQCPLYEGPGGRIGSPPVTAGPSSSAEMPIALKAVWPVRHPGAVDGLRVLIRGLTILSLGLLGWSLTLGVAALGGYTDIRGLALAAVAAASVSMVTHLLTALKAWAGR
jgi:hypothetical protein